MHSKTHLRPPGKGVCYWTSSFGGYGPGSGSVGWTMGSGRVLSLSTFSDNKAPGSPAYDQMLANSLDWASRTSRGSDSPPPPTPAIGPEPGSLAVFALAGLGLWIASRTRRPAGDWARGHGGATPGGRSAARRRHWPGQAGSIGLGTPLAGPVCDVPGHRHDRHLGGEDGATDPG